MNNSTKFCFPIFRTGN
ncbi:peptide IlvX [Escherichia coli]|nr:hypothetical protein [Escherichia coli]